MAFWTSSINFSQLTSKATPVGADSVLIADSATTPAGQPKQCLISALPFAPAAGAAVVNITSATQAAAIDTIYFVNYTGGTCTVTIPTAASSSQGSFIEVIGGEANTVPFVLASNASQQMRFDTNLTTASSGVLTSDSAFCSIKMRCDALSGGLTWTVISAVGNFSGT